jgi:hypothetical protein
MMITVYCAAKMSAWGQTRTSNEVHTMSASPSISTKRRTSRKVGDVTTAVVGTSKSPRDLRLFTV